MAGWSSPDHTADACQSASRSVISRTFFDRGDLANFARVSLRTPSEDLMAFRITAAAATIMFVMLPASATAQAAAKTACKDGTTTTATGAAACNGHGGIHSGRTALLRRSPGRTKATENKQPARVAQAGTPARADHSRPEEVRGWRWARHHDKDEKHEKREANRHRVRCRDGRYEEVKEHGKGKGPEVCKHHGRLAR